MQWIENLFRLAAGVWCVLLLSAVRENNAQQNTTGPKFERVAVGVSSFSPAATSTIAPVPTTTTAETAPRLCGQWWGLALQAGWTQDQLPTLDYVMWRESRCLADRHNTTLNGDGSTDIGLTQINDWSWCLPTRWYPDGYLQTVGVLTTVGCAQLFDPYTNLLAAKTIHDYSQETNRNGWQPWGL
jgi:hypothetical protein